MLVLYLLHLLLELRQVEMLVLRPSVLSLTKFDEKLKVPLAFVARLEDRQIFQCLNSQKEVTLKNNREFLSYLHN